MQTPAASDLIVVVVVPFAVVLLREQILGVKDVKLTGKPEVLLVNELMAWVPPTCIEVGAGKVIDCESGTAGLTVIVRFFS